MRGRLGDDRGQSTAVNVFLLAAVVGALYLGWVYLQPTLDYFDMCKAVRVACNYAYSHRSTDDVRDSLMKSWREIDPQEKYLDSDGSVHTRPVPFGENRNIDVELQETPPQVTVRIHYTRHLVFPYLNRERVTEWEYSHTEDLSRIKW